MKKKNQKQTNKQKATNIPKIKSKAKKKKKKKKATSSVNILNIYKHETQKRQHNVGLI